MSAPLQPDENSLKCFVAAIFKHANRHGFISLRAFEDSTKTTKDKAVFVEPINFGHPQFMPVVVERARQAANWCRPAVFCPPVVTFRDTGSATTENILEGVALSVECDQHPNDAIATLTDLLGEPTITVASGGEWENTTTGECERKLHIYWRLRSPTRTADEHKLLHKLRDLATKLVGADATNISLVHPIRWPGSWHTKTTPRLAQIVFESDHEIDLGEALHAIEDATGTKSEGISPKNLRAANSADVASALALIPNDNLDWETWNRVGMATWTATEGSDEGLNYFAEWSAKARKNDPETTAARWAHLQDIATEPDRVRHAGLSCTTAGPGLEGRSRCGEAAAPARTRGQGARPRSW